MTETVKRTHCPGSDRPITKEELNDVKRVKDKWGHIDKYKCKDCGKYYTRNWTNRHFTRHGFKMDETEKQYREQKKLEKQRAEEEKQRKKAAKEEERRFAKLLAEGKICFCAECDTHIFDITDYLCAECRSLM